MNDAEQIRLHLLRGQELSDALDPALADLWLERMAELLCCDARASAVVVAIESLVCERERLVSILRKQRQEVDTQSYLERCLRRRPLSLTGERAESFLPKMEICPEWQAREDQGLNDGLLGMFGMLRTIWPESRPTLEEAIWMQELSICGTLRWFASMVTHGDDNQITGGHLLEVANRVVVEHREASQ